VSAPAESGPRATRLGRPPVALTAAGLTAVVLTTWVLLGTWGSGQYLFRDFVAVPDPVVDGLVPTTSAALRAWPLDAVTWALSGVVPTGVQQLVLLGGCLVLAGTGAGLVAGVLAGRYAASAAVAAAGLAVWNPYVTERLLLGQVPTLLGYAAMPWVLLVAWSGAPTVRRTVLLVLAAAPAALTPWGGLVALVTAVTGALARPGRRLQDVVVVGVVGVLWCLPWVVPALLAAGGGADPDGALAFALADDTGLGTWGSALLGGGVWAQGARPLSREDPLAVGASVLVLALALVGGVLLWRRSGRAPGTVALAAVLLPASLLAVLSGPLLGLTTAAQAVPGAALLRDQHRLLAPAVLATAVLAGTAVGPVARHGGRAAAALATALALVVAVTSVPDLPGRTRAAYVPRHYPAGWGAVVAAVEARPGPQRVLSLPWQPFRATSWSGGRPFLDPLPRAVADDVLASTTLTVRRDGHDVVVDDRPLPEDSAWAEGDVTADGLRRQGVTVVVEWLGTPGALARAHDGWRLLEETADFRAWDVTGAR
jgi:hypothetical protein